MSHTKKPPASAVLYEQRWTRRRAAAEINVDFTHFANVMAGYARPCPELIERLSALLGLPPEQLFTADMLAKPYQASLRKSGPVAW